MMGHQAGAQERLFYSFNLEDPVPDDHLLRGIDRFLDLSHLHQHLAEFYSHTGRPSIDPELMIRTLISVTALAFARKGDCARKSISIWRTLVLSLGRVPDHSSFS